MGLARDLIDEQIGLASQRHRWEVYWRDIARYVLPQSDQYDEIIGGGSLTEIMGSVTGSPNAAERAPDLYDATSLWGVERLAAGLLSLKTPESALWHDLGLDDDWAGPNTQFGSEPDHEEKIALQRLRNYLFGIRSNPKSGFWPAWHEVIRSVAAFGDGWLFIRQNRDMNLPIFAYEYLPLYQLYPVIGRHGIPERMFRRVRITAYNAAKRFGIKKLSAVAQTLANDPAKRHTLVPILHAVIPREGKDRDRLGNYGAAFASYYLDPDESKVIHESGFNSFPFARFAWQTSGRRPFTTGPVALALGEVKSLQEMAKNELIASQTALRPPYAIAAKNHMRLNLNPGASNPGLINQRGAPLFAPLTNGTRPDFATTIMEQRRARLDRLLYIDLWQALLSDPQMTATQAMLRAQEKGEILGPVGISLNGGLAAMVDREISVLGDERAFNEGSPLALPPSLSERTVAPVFTSPLDKLRRIGELTGMQRVVEFFAPLAEVKPDLFDRFDFDTMLDKAVDILGAPQDMLRGIEDVKEGRAGQQQIAQLMQLITAAQQGGAAAKSLGEGAAALTQGAETASVGGAPSRLASLLGGAA